MREREVETYLKDQTEAHGGECIKLQYINRRGATDRLVLLPGWGFFAEVKRPGAKAEAHQTIEHKLLRDAGFQVFLLDTKQKIDAVFHLYRKDRKNNA